MNNTFENNFEGFIKLKKDPKGMELNISNILLREEINLNAEWVYGIVIYSGNECKTSLFSSCFEVKRQLST